MPPPNLLTAQLSKDSLVVKNINAVDEVQQVAEKKNFKPAHSNEKLVWYSLARLLQVIGWWEIDHLKQWINCNKNLMLRS